MKRKLWSWDECWSWRSLLSYSSIIVPQTPKSSGLTDVQTYANVRLYLVLSLQSSIFILLVCILVWGKCAQCGTIPLPLIYTGPHLLTSIYTGTYLLTCCMTVISWRLRMSLGRLHTVNTATISISTTDILRVRSRNYKLDMKFQWYWKIFSYTSLHFTQPCVEVCNLRIVRILISQYLSSLRLRPFRRLLIAGVNILQVEFLWIDRNLVHPHFRQNISPAWWRCRSWCWGGWWPWRGRGRAPAAAPSWCTTSRTLGSSWE